MATMTDQHRRDVIDVDLTGDVLSLSGGMSAST
jgi:hypothetical protein